MRCHTDLCDRMSSICLFGCPNLLYGGRSTPQDPDGPLARSSLVRDDRRSELMFDGCPNFFTGGRSAPWAWTVCWSVTASFSPDRFDRSTLTVQTTSFRKLGIYTPWPSLLELLVLWVFLSFLKLFS